MVLAAVPTVVGLLIAVPIGWIARAHPALRVTFVSVSGLLYTIPSLALFVALPTLIGTRILDPLNVVVALTIYTVALLVRTVVDGLDSVPADVRAAATAMGYRPVRRLLQVELPVAVPVVGAGVRVAAVTNVSIVSVAALIGVPQLGQLLTQGFQLASWPPIITGIVGCVVVAVVFDIVVMVVVHYLTGWQRAGAHR
ncbi:MAG: ABC transporter permease subunit [Actinomycetota bacterium]|nr:MAG: ABC transporter permease subunit [Actinomycetota bacterium]